ncbi:hypothetical protein SISSUDRAFT_1131481 [Sistotremastrum suecicum HHB10207 ss-3]|uniref:Ser-Thr-rich glycosyl-phosphatidyl-inositol-anchored membrane family-domain-containing protein n=1 Tax=Sistotremastrum suecicum HHB10207 ss-3 TaxID=1314776 RepID=A0A166A4I2_9AGAM|nr:hypothetical protein SISSUDRAFT_1131481 [Sistotremastrum suecicum HHB10207 ss-3]
MLFTIIPLFTLSFVSASLFPTVPISSTTLHGNRNNTVHWIDSSSSSGNTYNPNSTKQTFPALSSLGKLSIELWGGPGNNVDDTLLSVLDDGVNPSKGEASLYFPPFVGSNGPYYFLRFVPSHSGSPSIYTARFSMDNMDGPSFNATGSNTVDSDPSDAASTSSQLNATPGSTSGFYTSSSSTTINPTSAATTVSAANEPATTVSNEKVEGGISSAGSGKYQDGSGYNGVLGLCFIFVLLSLCQ